MGVLFGGQSEEHRVSVMSARAIFQALADEPYDVIPMAIDRRGRWMVGRRATALLSDGEYDGPGAVKNLAATELQAPPKPFPEDLEPFVPERIQNMVDVVIPVLHGPMGEDGTVQGLLELAAVPYVGSGVLGSALGMDKIAMKTILGAHGLPQVAYHGVTRRAVERARDQVVAELEGLLAYPMFVKPANLGSSVGVSKATDGHELRRALALAARYDRRIIVEQGVRAREFEVGILGLEDAQASVVGEVVVQGHEFYDYDAKYVDRSTVLTVPAEIPVEITEQMRALALTAFHALDCAGLARVDFFWAENSSTVWVNEVNTLPGFTPFSMYPRLWNASGVPYRELVRQLIEFALKRANERRYGDPAPSL